MRIHAPFSIPLAALCVLTIIACSGGSEDGPRPQVLIGGPTGISTPTPVPEVLGAGATPAPVTPSRSPMVVSLDWPSPDASLPGLPSLAPPRPDAGLARALESALANTPGRTSLVVHNLADGRYAAFNENEVYYAASLFKMGILYEVYKQRDAGILDMQRLLTLEAKYAEYDLGTLEALGLAAGDMLTVEDAVGAMAVASDTPTAVLLQDTVGCKTADETLASLGIQATRFCDRDLPATAADMTRLIEAVAGGVGVSDASRNEMLTLMFEEYYRQGVIAGVPDGTFVAHKTGSYSGATHDVAVVWGHAGPYVISVLTDQPSNWGTIAAVSSAVWTYFVDNPA